MKRRKRFLFLVGVFFFVLILMGSGQGEASDCYIMYFDWECDLNNSNNWQTLYVSKHKDGSFQVEGFLYGSWFDVYGDCLLISVPSGCEPLYVLVKNKTGFMVCDDGSSENKAPGCWKWKKTKISKDTCWWINELGSSGTAEEATTGDESDE
jgi:hypothetical protein